MKTLFTFNKFFISFCVFFILVWVALQVVSYMRLESMAKFDGDQILSWTWPSKNIKSLIKIYDTKIIRKEHNDAIVKITAHQTVEPIIAKELSATAPEPSCQSSGEGQLKSESECTVTLTYYRTNNQWCLGEVQLK